MSNVDVKVSSGQLDVSKEKNLLVWALGKHRSLEHQWERTITCFVLLIFKLKTNKYFYLHRFSGPKFPKSREVTMEGKISFLGSAPGPTDPLCTELTAYLKVR